MLTKNTTTSIIIESKGDDMNEQSKDVATLQNVINYYRNKCSDLEYKFVLYQTKVEEKIKEFEQRLDAAGVAESKKNSSKSRKSDEKT